MSGRQSRRDWAVARVLLTDQLAFLLLVWAAFAAVVAAVTVGIAIFGTVSTSIWDGAASFLRWLALGYGIHLVSKLLPAYVAHGRTRREFLLQAAVFLAVAVAVLAALMTLGYALEAVVYRALDWPRELSQGRLYTSSGQLPLVFGTYLAAFAVWVTAGMLLAAGFYRGGGSVLLVIPVALLMVAAVGISVGYGLPLDRILDVTGIAGVPPAVTVALPAGALLLGAACTWALARDLPIRTRPR